MPFHKDFSFMFAFNTKNNEREHIKVEKIKFLMSYFTQAKNQFKCWFDEKVTI
jgi:hypothetical protein